MTEIINPKSGDREENFNREIYRLLLFYKQLTQLLETYFSGDLIIPTDEINRNYLRLCNKIGGILGKPDFKDLARHNWQPFDNLRTFNPDAPDSEWEYGGQQVCGNFLSAIDELFIGTGERTYPLDTEEQQLLTHVQTYLEKYRSYKTDYEKRWLQKSKKEAEEDWKKRGEKTQMKMPQFDFKFIRDKEIKNLLTKDWEEAQKAFQNELHKATVLLCGTILESLLIDALSCSEKEAKSNYYQKYLEGKNKGNKTPEIENWQLYQLIEIAKQQGIISADVAKLSHIVRDYRN
ncbi:MAG: hypothetical protein AEth_01177, partial [Candidatus Argoarchaeum ethanivorans]